LAADVVDEIAIGRVPLEDLSPHQVDERRRVRGETEEAALRLHLHDLDPAMHEDAVVIGDARILVIEPPLRVLALAGPRAHDAHVVSALREARGELEAEALGSADRRVAALDEEQPHRGTVRTMGASVPLTTPRRSR